MEMENKKNSRIINAKTLMAALFVASVFVLAVKLMNPTPVQISVDGGKTIIEQIPGVFTYFDTAIMNISSITLGASAMFFTIQHIFLNPIDQTKEKIINRKIKVPINKLNLNKIKTGNYGKWKKTG